MSVNEFPGTVAMDFRFEIPVEDAEYLVTELEYLAREEGWRLDYPPGEALPYEHTLPEALEVLERLGYEGGGL